MAVQAESGKSLPLTDLKARIRALVKVPPPAYGGAMLLHKTVEAVSREADLIVIAFVNAVRPRFTPARTSIETEVTLDVERVLKGRTGGRLTLTVEGGAVGNLQVLVGGIPTFWPAERVLVFLAQGAAQVSAAPLSLVGLWQGKFSLVSDLALQPETGKAFLLRDIEARIQRAVATPFAGRADVTPVLVQAPFTTFCLPWTPSQVPVPHAVNPASPGAGAPAGAAFVKLMQQSFQAWQDVSTAWVSARIAGTTTRDATDHFDGNHDVAWSGSLGSGVLGVNSCALSESTRLDSDTRFANTVTWSTNAAAGTIDLDSVARHEFGHDLGLGHSDVEGCDGGPTTPLMCAAISSGVEKTLLSDDINGVVSLYPLSGLPPAAPSGLTASAVGTTAGLQWTGVAGALAYEVQRASESCSAGFQAVNSVPANTTTFTDDDLGAGLPAGIYCYRVKALGQGGDSGFSSPASVTVATAAYVSNWLGGTVSVIDPLSNSVVTTVAVGNKPAGVAVNPAGTRAYVANHASHTISVIDTATNQAVATVPVGNGPHGLAAHPAGTRVYVPNADSDTVSVIDTATNQAVATVPVGNSPWGVAVNPGGTRVYVANYSSHNISVIDTETNQVVATAWAGASPWGVALNPAGTRLYVTNDSDRTVSVIDTATHQVIATIPLGNGPLGVAVNAAGTRVYVANIDSDTVSVIDAATNQVIATVPVGNGPLAMGQFTR